MHQSGIFLKSPGSKEAGWTVAITIRLMVVDLQWLKVDKAKK
jgi:hypothetical protein